MCAQFKEHYIEHLLEPVSLLMTWQHSETRIRHTIAELSRSGEKITLRYLVDAPDFRRACELGFDYYPVFPNIYDLHENGVLDSLMRRLPPRSRTDYAQYLEGFRIPPMANLSDFALLGYTGAKLPSDGFAIINPFSNVTVPFEFLLEAAGYRHINDVTAEYGDQVTFQKESTADSQEDAIKILLGNQHIGYVTRALIPNFLDWMSANRIVEAWVEKKNESPDQPAIYLYVKISAHKALPSEGG